MSGHNPIKGGSIDVKVHVRADPSSTRAAGASSVVVPEVQVERATSTPEPKLATRTMALPRATQKERPVEAGYEEHLQRLEKVIEEQAAEVVAEVAEVAAELGLEPKDITMVWAIDITDRQDVKCSFCGRPSCQFRPVQYRVKNPEVDLLGDTITVLQELGARAGVQYGMIVYDEEVLVLREPGLAEDQRERAETLQRYTEFRDRKEYPDPNSRSWLDKVLAKWNPADATRRIAGEPADARMFDTAFRVIDGAGGALKAMVLVKAVEPRIALRGIEARAKAKGIQPSAMAVGKRAAEVAMRLLSDTKVAPDLHQVREEVGARFVSALEAIRDLKKEGA